MLIVAAILLLVAGVGFFLWPTDDTADISLRGASMPVAPNGNATAVKEEEEPNVPSVGAENAEPKNKPTVAPTTKQNVQNTQPTPGTNASSQPPQPTTQPKPVALSPWEAIKYAVQNCEVDAVFQTESLRVTAKMKNGERLVATEPKIDEIIRVARAAEPRCGKIGIATE